MNKLQITLIEYQKLSFPETNMNRKKQIFFQNQNTGEGLKIISTIALSFCFKKQKKKENRLTFKFF